MTARVEPNPTAAAKLRMLSTLGKDPRVTVHRGWEGSTVSWASDAYLSDGGPLEQIPCQALEFIALLRTSPTGFRVTVVDALFEHDPGAHTWRCVLLLAKDPRVPP